MNILKLYKGVNEWKSFNTSGFYICINLCVCVYTDTHRQTYTVYINKLYILSGVRYLHYNLQGVQSTLEVTH